VLLSQGQRGAVRMVLIGFELRHRSSRFLAAGAILIAIGLIS
jgi:hypothetical protein